MSLYVVMGPAEIQGILPGIRIVRARKNSRWMYPGAGEMLTGENSFIINGKFQEGRDPSDGSVVQLKRF